jgi:hypothetical protein
MPIFRPLCVTRTIAPALLLILAGAGSSVGAAELLVPSQFTSLQVAIDAAASGDVIRLAPGVYAGAISINGKSITIDGGGAATLNAEAAESSVLTITGVSGGPVNIRGLTITGGRGNQRDTECWPFGPVQYGGGVFVSSSQVILTNVTLSDNRATLGGGLWYERGSNVTLDGCLLTNNFASEIGAAAGGCWFDQANSLTIRGSTVSFNTLITSGGRYGIVTPGAGELTVTTSTFASNTDTLAVIHTPNAPLRLVVQDSTFRDNRRLFGSITIFQNILGSSVLVERCDFQDEDGGEEGGRGGVLLIANGVANGVVRDSTFRAVITNGVEAVLQGGGTFRVERCRMSEMPDGSLGIFALSNANVVVSDVQATGGDEGMNFLVYDRSTLRVDRVSMIETIRNAITVNLSGGGQADFSNVIAAESGRDGLEVRSTESADPDSPPDRMTMNNLTLTRNAIGLRMQGVFTPGSYTLTNSIVALNTLTDLLPGLEPTVPLARFCIIDEGFAGAAPSVFAADPLFVDAPGRDFRLRADSPAIDAGDNSGVQVDTLTDFGGDPRVADAPNPNTGLGTGPIVDIGAFEFVPPITRCNAADVAYDNGTALPPAGPSGGGSVNNGVTEGDYNLFFANFFDALPVCDIANDDGSPLPPFGVLAVNNGVTEADYNLFFAIFFDGCSF